MPEDVDLATIPAKDKTFEQKVEAVFANFKKEELEKISMAFHVLDEHENLKGRSIDKLWLEISTIILNRKEEISG